MNPLFTCVIPTRERPGFCLRALKSVLSQTMDELEVFVVIDGACPETEQAVMAFQDERVRILVNQRPMGGALARNRGALAGQAPYVAFLDDDDQWLPWKLEKQLPLLQDYQIVSCRLMGKFGDGYRVVTTDLPTLAQSMAEYLFLPARFPLNLEVRCQTSSLVIERGEFERSPFRDLPRHHDWDLLINLAEQGASYAVHPEPLCYFDLGNHRRLSTTAEFGRFSSSLAWAESIKGKVSPGAYAALLLGHLLPYARQEGDVGGIGRCWSEALSTGSVSTSLLARGGAATLGFI